MELIAAAIAFYAVFMPMFLATEIATPHPAIARRPVLASAEDAAAAYLAAHPLKPVPAVAAANDPLERIAA
jgi:hypothetical protein